MSRVDLHCHYLPAVDDGVRDDEEAFALLEGLRALGYERVVATPHMRTEMFPNTKSQLVEAFSAFAQRAADYGKPLPILGLASEHFFDDVFWQRWLDKAVLPYPGGQGLLVELPPRRFPMGLQEAFFRMELRGVSPVLAHPERYDPLFRASDLLEPLIAGGVLPQLDLMSLVGRYGSKPQAAAQRMLEEGVYHLACSDCHRPQDVDLVAKAIGELESRVGAEEATRLLATHPSALALDEAKAR